MYLSWTKQDIEVRSHSRLGFMRRCRATVTLLRVCRGDAQ